MFSSIIQLMKHEIKTFIAGRKKQANDVVVIDDDVIFIHQFF
jgi:hypothetical protein